jgi:hypothetical protein
MNMKQWWSSLSLVDKEITAAKVPANKNYLDQIANKLAVPSMAMAVRLTEVSNEKITFDTWRAYAKRRNAKQEKTFSTK